MMKRLSSPEAPRKGRAGMLRHIKGYRELTKDEIAIINEIKRFGEILGQLVDGMRGGKNVCSILADWSPPDPYRSGWADRHCARGRRFIRYSGSRATMVRKSRNFN